MLAPPIQQSFNTFEQAHEHITSVGMQQGYRPIRMRSSKGKSAYYACQKGREMTHRVPDGQRRRQQSSRSERTNCPWAVYVGYRKDGLWHLEVRCADHNHGPDDFAGLKLRDLPLAQRDRVKTELLTGIKPSDVLARLQLEISNLDVTIRDIYNEAARLKRDSRPGDNTEIDNEDQQDQNGQRPQQSQGSQQHSGVSSSGVANQQQQQQRYDQTLGDVDDFSDLPMIEDDNERAILDGHIDNGGSATNSPQRSTTQATASSSTRAVANQAGTTPRRGADLPDKPTLEKTMAQYFTAYAVLPESIRDEAVRKLQFLVVDLQKQGHKVDQARQREDQRRRQDAADLHRQLDMLRRDNSGSNDVVQGRQATGRRQTEAGAPYPVPGANLARRIDSQRAASSAAASVARQRRRGARAAEAQLADPTAPDPSNEGREPDSAGMIQRTMSTGRSRGSASSMNGHTNQFDQMRFTNESGNTHFAYAPRGGNGSGHTATQTPTTTIADQQSQAARQHQAQLQQSAARVAAAGQANPYMMQSFGAAAGGNGGHFELRIPSLQRGGSQGHSMQQQHSQQQHQQQQQQQQQQHPHSQGPQQQLNGQAGNHHVSRANQQGIMMGGRATRATTSAAGR
ncbi:hypothetical protein PYCC9005_001164 [Savitreella phatthalungensis]